MKFSSEQNSAYFEEALVELPNGEQVSTLCPFHDDERASLSVNTEEGLWNCHAGCGAGTIVDFEKKHSKCDYNTAMVNVQNLLIEIGVMDDFVYEDEAKQPLLR